MLESKKAQNEMVGFILMVVLVMIGLMIFLVISLRTSPDAADNLEVSNMLSAIMTHTTACAIPSTPYYENFEDLFKSCYENDDCAGTVGPACDYLNETLPAILEDLMASEATVDSYQLDFSVADEIGVQGIIRIFEGECEGEVLGSQRKISISRGEDLIVRLRICRED